MSATNSGPAVTTTENPTILTQGRPKLVTGYRTFYNESDGSVYDCVSASNFSMLIPNGLNWSKGIVVELPVSAATITILPDTNVLLNGANSPLTRALSATQRVISIFPRNAPDSYEVTGS